MPDGKPAGVPCVQLTATYGCAIYGQPDRPACCAALRPAPDLCGTSRTQALQIIGRLEVLTAPGA
jgi:hypothetical protein